MAMAFTFALFLCVAFLLLMESGAQSGNSTEIKLGSSLSPKGNYSWLSPSGHFAFGFYPQGDRFYVGVWLINPNSSQNTVVWTANRDDPPVSIDSSLVLSVEGKLLLFTGENRKPIADVLAPAGSAAMLDSGNFQLYGLNSSVIWESFDYPTDTILGRQVLNHNRQLVSSESATNQSSGHFSLSMQDDGNLVAYPFNTPNGPEDSYWSTGSFGVIGHSYLSLDEEGSLAVVLPNSSTITLAFANSTSLSKNKTSIYRATLDVDGNFRLYSHHFESPSTMSVVVHWAALSDQCDVHGFCGLNSYCSAMDGRAHCSCFPGFDLAEPNNQFSDCFRNLSEDDCNRKTLIHMENVIWGGDFPYFSERMAMPDCATSCNADCNCEAAIYKDNSCNKYKLPLRYAKQNISIRSTVFLTSINNSVVTNDVPPSIQYASRRSLLMILKICLAFASFSCFVFAVLSIFFYARRAHRYKKLSKNAKMRLEEELTMRSFTYEDLKKVTNGFKELIGRGSFGQIYKGFLPANNRPVAVKKLEKMIGGEREFRVQMATIGRTHHRNLVRVLGFCIEGPKVLLVYEFMSNGSLAKLFKERTSLSWRERLKIALDMARGLLYLHEECQVPITHYNIKPENILLDDTMTAKITDFGLAKLLMPNQTRASKYLAPEWQNNTLMSRQSDIYSMGIVFLEIACCRSNIEMNVARADEIALTVWAYNCYMAGRLDELVDEENVDMNILGRMVKVALLCIQDQPPLRPPVKHVILMLEQMMDIPDPPPSAALVIS